ncbi:MAG: conjugal transfer protein TrbK, partial [Mesorhizobium sp.]
QVLQPQPAPQAPGPQGQSQNLPPARDPAVYETTPTIDSHTNEVR